MVEAAGVELLRHLKTRKLLMTKQQEGPESPECQIGCTLLYGGCLSRNELGPTGMGSGLDEYIGDLALVEVPGRLQDRDPLRPAQIDIRSCL
jgi:hypothetical protein